MKTQLKRTATMYLATAFLVALLSSASLAQVAIIVNKSVPIKSADASTVLDIYNLTMKEWPDGSPIVVVMMKGNDNTVQKLYQFIGRRALEMKKLWMRAQLSGEGRVPISLSSDEDIVAKVASTPGAIGFVRELKADNSVRTIAIIE